MEVKPLRQGSVQAGYKQTEVGVVPEEWELKDFDTLGNVIDGDRGTQYPGSSDFSESGHCLFLNAGNVTKGGFRFEACAFITREKDAALNKGKLKRDDIVLTTRGTIGNLAHFSATVPFENMRINSGMVILRNASASLDTGYLYALLQSRLVDLQIERLTFGSAQPQLTVRDINKFEVVVPPLPEQRAIATALSDVDALLGALDRLITKKRDLKQAAMQQLLTGQTRLPGFSGEWGILSVSRNASLKARIGWQALTTEEYLASGTHYLVTGTDFIGGRVNWGTCHFVDQWRYNQDRNIQLKNGDVLVTKDGTIGKVGFVEGLPGPATLNSGVFVIRPLQDSFVPAFLFYVLRSRVFDNFIATITAGSTITHLYQKDFVGFEFRAPGLDEQTAIAAVLSDMDAELALLEQRLAKTRALKQGMMQELLTGRTRLV
jgi:type I restriction enzyme S subunit